MRLGDRELCYRRGAPLRHADRIALRVTVGGAFEWTDVAREDFASGPPDSMQVEVTLPGRKRFTRVYEYRQPTPLEAHGTP